MEKIKFSIIVPVYNAEKYLHECIDSVLNQDYENFELILVNDGSKDSGPRILDEYAKKNNRIKVIHKENEGQLLTRCRGIDAATGDYLLFLDSDDYWTDGAFKRIYETILKYDCDMVLFNCLDVVENKQKKSITLCGDETVYDVNNKERLYNAFLTTSKLNTVWSKATKKDLINSIDIYKQFSCLRYGEDAVQCAKLLIKAQKIVSIPDCLYCYRIGVGVTSNIIPQIVRDNLILCEYKIKCFEDIDYDGKAEDIADAYLFYLEDSSKNILASYAKDKKQTKEIVDWVINHPTYLKAKTQMKRVDVFTKFIWFLSEHKLYFLYNLISFFRKIRLKILKRNV